MSKPFQVQRTRTRPCPPIQFSEATTRPYVYAVTSEDRELVKSWLWASQPHGITKAEFLFFDDPADDPGQAPCLDIWTRESDDLVYVLGAPECPGTDKWSVTFVSPTDRWISWGRFPLGKALNKVRPCLDTLGWPLN